MHEVSKMRVLVARWGRVSLLPVRERSRRLLLRTGLRDRTIHPKRGGTSGLLASQARGRVSSATSLDTIGGIAPRDRDPRVMGNHSPNHRETCIDTV